MRDPGIEVEKIVFYPIEIFFFAEVHCVNYRITWENKNFGRYEHSKKQATIGINVQWQGQVFYVRTMEKRCLEERFVYWL